MKSDTHRTVKKLGFWANCIENSSIDQNDRCTNGSNSKPEIQCRKHIRHFPPQQRATGLSIQRLKVMLHLLHFCCILMYSIRYNRCVPGRKARDGGSPQSSEIYPPSAVDVAVYDRSATTFHIFLGSNILNFSTETTGL